MSSHSGGGSERVIHTLDGRRVVTLGDGDLRQIVRRVACGSPSECARRAAGIRKLVAKEISGFNLITDCKVRGEKLEVMEAFVDGFSLGGSLKLVQERITVDVTLALMHDLVRGLCQIQAVDSSLRHGRLGLGAVLITPSGNVRVTGFEAASGRPKQDVEAVMLMLQQLLASRATSRQGSALLERLAQLHFEEPRPAQVGTSSLFGPTRSESTGR